MTMKRNPKTGQYVSVRDFGDPPDPDVEAQIADLQAKIAEADARESARKQAKAVTVQARALIESAGLKPDDTRLAPAWQHGPTPQGLAALQAAVAIIAPPGAQQKSGTANRADTLSGLKARFSKLRGTNPHSNPAGQRALRQLHDDARSAGYSLGDLA